MMRIWGISVLTMALAACATTPPPQPGTGDVSFRLTWKGTEDLDLHVEDPDDEELSFIQRRSRSGGLLDIDCNAGPEKICEHPIENVYWPEGTAPEGRYVYRVELFRSIAGSAAHSTYIEGREVPRGSSEEARQNAESRVAFILEVRLGERVVVRHHGELTQDIRVAGPFEYRFRRAEHLDQENE